MKRFLCVLVALLTLTSSRTAKAVTLHGHDVIDDPDDAGWDFDEHLDDIVESPFRYAIDYSSRRFPNGVVPYVINKGFTADQVEKIKQEMSYLENFTKYAENAFCIKFRPKTNADRRFINIQHDNGITCDSQVGSMSIGTRLRLANRCIPRSIIHELMHSLGFWHEHNRDDRDNYVTVLWDKVEEDEKVHYEKVFNHATNQSIPYDYGSAVHYMKAIIPKRDNYLGGRRKALNVRISESDVLRIQRYYSCPENNKEYKKAIPPIFLDCTFEKGLCNMTQVNRSTNFEWTRAKAPAGRVSDRGYYMIAKAKGHQNRKAILRSPVMKKGCYRISMAFHRGSLRDGNSLRMDATYVPSFAYRPLRTYYYTSANDYWTLVTKDDNLFNVPWALSIEATIGPNSTTDISIDDIIIMEGCEVS